MMIPVSPDPARGRFLLPAAALLAALALLPGCGPKPSGGGGSAGKDQEGGSFPPQDITAEVDRYYETKVYLPPKMLEDLERGAITQEQVDAQVAAGGFPRFFRFATPADIPTHLRWDNGQDLPDLGSPEAKKGGTLNRFLQDYPRTLRLLGPDSNGGFRPYLLDDVMLQFAHRHPTDTRIGPDGFYYFPGVAREWAVDKPNKTVYVRLDPEARWSDGVPITSDDVLFMFFLFQTKYINAPWYNNWYNRNYTGITRFDDHTFAISVPEAKPDLNARVLELRPMPRHFYRELGDDYEQRYQWRFQPTSGPYVVRDQDVQKGRFIQLTRLQDWWARDRKFWRHRFNYDEIRFTIIRDNEKAFEVFRKGDIDYFGLGLPKYWYDKLPDEDPLVANGYIGKYTFYNDRPRPTYGLWMNQSKPLLDNRDIRIGIQHATNWQKVIDSYFRGDYVRMRTSSDGYGEFTHPTLQARPFDIQKALEHFARAGFTQRGPDGVLRNSGGQRLAFTLSTGYEAFKDLLVILKEEALRAGLEFNIDVKDQTTGWKLVQEKQHDISFTAFAIFPEMYPRYWETYHSVNAYDVPFLPDGSINPERKVKTQTNNLETFSLPEMDALIEAYAASEDAEEMKRLSFRMEEIIHDNASFSPGFVAPFMRWGAWRWVQFPETGDVKLAGSVDEFFLGWIEPGRKEETLAAQRANKPLPPIHKRWDQYNAYAPVQVSQN